MGHHVVTDYTTNISTENSNVKVFVRARPCADGSRPPEEFYRPDGSDRRKITVKDPNVPGAAATAFAFDEVFWTDTSQSQIYQACCEPMIKHCLKGFNSCLFAYGQTGSGKTYNIFGEDSNRGIIPRAVTDLFASLENIAAVKNVALAVSFLEIYNDQIRDIGQAYLDKMEKTNGGQSPKKEARDLMTSEWYKKKQLMNAMDIDKDNRGVQSEASPALTINEDQEKNIFVRDLAVIPVTSESEVIAIVQSGLRLRATHETQMNAVSSRSHTVFTITIVQKDHATGEEMTGMLNLVDLAGSERLKKSESEGARLQEALHINSSLSALGKVIVALDPAAGSTHIPYRDSKLTRLLQNSIGGNSYTTLLATIHPTESHTSESVSTLQFANRCRAVTNQPRVNYSSKTELDKDRQIKRLLEEIIQLRGIIQEMSAEKITFAIGLLRSMGMDAQPGPDGSIMVMNEKGELQELKFTVGADGKPAFQLTKGGIAHSNRDKGGKGDGEDSYRMRVELDRVTRERDNSKKKLKVQKEAYKNLQAQLMESNRRCAQIASDQKQVVDRLQQSIEQQQYTQQLNGDQQRDSFREQMEALVAHNTKLMNHNTMQATSSRKLMKGVEGYSQFGDESGGGASAGGKHVSKAEVGRRLKQQQEGHEVEIAALHQKYQYWVKQHCQTEEAFVTRFNDYARTKQQQLSVWRNESTQLYGAAVALEQHLQLYEQEESRANPSNSSGYIAVGGGAAAARSSRSTYNGGGNSSINSSAMLMPAGAGGRVPVGGNRGHSASRGRLHHQANGGGSIGPDGVGMVATAVARARGLLSDGAALQLTRRESEIREQQAGEDAAWEEGGGGGRRSGGRSQVPQSASSSKGRDRIVPIGVQRAQRHSDRPTSAPAKPKQRHSDRPASALPASGGPGGGGGARPHSAIAVSHPHSRQQAGGAWAKARSPSKSRSRSANARVQIQSPQRIDTDSDEEDEQALQQLQQREEDGELDGELDGEEAALRQSIERRALEDERQQAEAVNQVMGASLVGMDEDDLKNHVKTLRRYISGGLEQRLQAKVLSQVQEHPTVQLIHSLENDKDHYKRKFTDESRKHRELRVAYRALVREEEKLRMHQYSSSHNPAGKSSSTHSSSSKQALLRRKQQQQQQQGRGQMY
jgi:hypothetical protein